MVRILILLQASDYADVEETLRSAVTAAADPRRLSFGLLLEGAPTEEELCALYGLGHVMWCCGPGTIWQRVDEMWSGENYLLLGHPAMRFARGWDRTLIRTLTYCQRLGNHHCALTGYLPRRTDPIDAVSPVAAKRFDRLGRLAFHRGTPLRYACHPQRSAFLHRDFCFAPAAFFRGLAGAQEPLFLWAYQTRWQLYTLHRPVIRLLWDDPLPPADVRAIDPEDAAIFESRFGIRFAEKQLSPMIRCGIFEPDLTFETRVPLGVRLHEAVRSVRLRSPALSPLCVTAWLSVPGTPLDERRMLAFRRLSRLRSLALLCFSDHENAPRITLSHPNVLDFKRRYGLEAPDALIQADYGNYVRLCKPFLLAQSREKFMLHSHYIWLDFDYLRYPVYERTALDWRELCTDRICLAMVGDQPDTSMLVLPQERIEPLCREISALCGVEQLAGRPLPQENDLFLRIMHDHPDWFHTIPCGEKRQLLNRTMPERGRELYTQA